VDKRGNRFIDITGQKFNRLFVISHDGFDSVGQAMWKCQCECGKIITSRGNGIRHGKTKSCGCLIVEHNESQKDNRLNRVGERFGRLTIKSKAEGHRKLWNVVCDCGVEKVVSYSNLSIGSVASCGCLKKEGNVTLDENPLQTKRRAYSIQGRYGISLDQFENLITAQNGRCAICQSLFSKTPHIDHDHFCCAGGNSCGKCIRGLLCSNCNTALGLLKDNTVVLENAIHYLKQPNEVELQLV
jgi:Recombination endonuclease VII